VECVLCVEVMQLEKKVAVHLGNEYPKRHVLVVIYRDRERVLVVVVDVVVCMISLVVVVDLFGVDVVWV